MCSALNGEVCYALGWIRKREGTGSKDPALESTDSALSGSKDEKWPEVCRPRRTRASHLCYPPYCCASDLDWRGSRYATVVVGLAVRAHSALLLCWFIRAQGRSPDGVCIVVLNTRSLHGLGASDDGLDVGYGAPYPAVWNRAYGVLRRTVCVQRPGDRPRALRVRTRPGRHRCGGRSDRPHVRGCWACNLVGRATTAGCRCLL